VTQERPLLALVMILKNEAHNIAKTIASVRGAVDRVVVLDTGSTDGTQDVVLAACQSAGIPLSLYEEPFVDFATTRNRCNELHAAEPDASVFTLMMSGDETLSGGAALREYLEAHREDPRGAHDVTMNIKFAYWSYPRVLRTDSKWKYVGKVHEAPRPPEGDEAGPTIPGVVITHAASDEDRRKARVRDYDFPTLQKLVEDESMPIVERANAMWFLAQTHETLAENECSKDEPGGAWLSHKMAAMALYRRRAELEFHYANLNGLDIFKVEDKAAVCLFAYYRIAEAINLYDHAELVWRLQKVVDDFGSKHPGLYWMIAAHTAQLEAETGLKSALLAADVAKADRQAPSGTPKDVRFEWLSLLLAIECAKHIGKTDIIPGLAARALEAGGSFEDFGKYVEPSL
jgi:hypothetical protein